MARKSKYNKIKPKVSPLTYIIVGLFFIGIVLTIVLSIDTPKQNFNKRFSDLENHNFELSKFKNVEKKIENNEELIVIINVGIKNLAPKALLTELNKMINEDESLLGDLKVIYYIEIKDVEILEDFFETYKVKYKSTPQLMYKFNNNELVAEYNGAKTYNELEAEDTETATLRRNIQLFFEQIEKAEKK